MLLTSTQVEESLTDTAEALTQLSEEIIKEPNIIIEYLKGCVPSLISFGVKILVALIIYLIGKKIIKIIIKLIDRTLDKTGADIGVVNFINSVVRILLYIVLALIIGGQFGVSTTSVVALVGSAGLAISLALQGSLSNFAGGVLLLILKPFKIGDYIIEQSTGNEGTVTDIDIFYTKLLTVDNKMVAMPNGNLINSSITNVTNEDFRRLDIIVGISYDSDMKKAKGIIMDILKSDPSGVHDKEMVVFVSDLADSAVMIGGRMWVKTEEYWQARWRVIEEVKLEFDKHKITIPFNQLDVNINQQ